MLKGIGVSPGIGLAQVLRWQAPITLESLPKKSEDPQLEMERYHTASHSLTKQTSELRQNTMRRFGVDEGAMFDIYRLILQDEGALLKPLEKLIFDENYSAEHAVAVQFGIVADKFMALNDDYMRQRADDIFSLRDQLIRELQGVTAEDASHLNHPTVIVAHALSPNDFASMDISRLEGVICETGAYQSHMSIIARTIGVPMVAGAAGILKSVQNGSIVALDGKTGEVWINPGESDIRMLHQRSNAQSYHGKPTVTLDGRRIELSASTTCHADVDTAMAADAEALGMIRTEKIYLNRPDLPEEDEQYTLYRDILEKIGSKSATLCTFDDGDHHNVFPPGILLNHCKEENPLLGYRGIRMCLGRPSFFRTQLRAMLRASAYGTLKIIFPMVSNLDELLCALDALEQVKHELLREHLPFDEKIQVGVSIEVPSAALLSKAIAEKINFLSVNINSLIQFTLAVDKSNTDLSSIHHQYHPSVLRLVRMAVEAAHSHDIPCLLSGEAADYRRVLPLMLGLRLDGFTVVPGTLLAARQTLCGCNYTQCQQLADKALECHTAGEVFKLLDNFNAAGEAPSGKPPIP